MTCIIPIEKKLFFEYYFAKYTCLINKERVQYKTGTVDCGLDIKHGLGRESSHEG